MQSENQSVSDQRDNRRLAMKLFPVHLVAWSSFLILWALLCKTEGNNSHDCEENDSGEVIVRGSSVEEESQMKQTLNETFSCYLYPTDIFNCSWSFHTLEKYTQLSVCISICGENVTSWNHSQVEKAGSWSWSLNEPLPSHVVIRFNMSRHNSWTSYTYAYETDMLEVLSPPTNISASVKDGRLLVMWGLPGSRTNENPNCFEYELDLGDKEIIKNLKEQQSYTELNDPTHTYRVRIRAKIITEHCDGAPRWSEWSHTVAVEQSVSKLNMLVILSISLGIPMILLAVLLLVRHQRVSKILFPPIPRPPSKYIYFLEKNDAPSFFYPAQASKAEEEITEVEDTEESTGEML